MILAIESAYLHQPMMLIGAGITERTINSLKVKGGKFSFDTAIGCLRIEVAGRVSLVPSANVAYMEPATEKVK